MVKRRPGSRIAAVVYESARGMFETGAIDAASMAEFDASCLVPVPQYLNGRKVRRLRRRYRLRQERLAEILNTSVEVLRRWEAGQTKRRGVALRLLQLLESGGLDAVDLGRPRQSRAGVVATPARRAG